jgi:exopolysaccharide biosynthesis WecB/TagA/CpsF family protein
VTPLTEVEVLGVPVRGGERADALWAIEVAAGRRPPVKVAFANAHMLNLAVADRSYRDLLERFDFVLNDGAGLALAGRIKGRPFAANLNGSDFTPLLLERCASRGWSVFLLGGRPGVAEAAAGRLRSRLPELVVAGVRDGYFAPEQEDEVAAQIASVGANVVLVALGNPRQEIWLDRHLGATGARLGAGVGAFLDFASGRVARAPAWMNALDIEWLWRLAQEPRRLWRRYVLGNPMFLARVARERLSARARRTGPGASGRSSAG